MKTYRDSISHFPLYVQECLMRGTQRVGFVGDLPADLSLLKGFADLGFENMGLSEDDYKALTSAFDGGGIRVPGTPHRLCHRSVRGLMELANGNEPALPTHWKQAVWVMQDEQFTWIGKKVRPEQIGEIDLAAFCDAGDGWKTE